MAAPLSRRSLFDVFRKGAERPGEPVTTSEPIEKPAKALSGFSLGEFYAARPAESALPHFAVKWAQASETTSVGSGATPGLQLGDAEAPVPFRGRLSVRASGCLAFDGSGCSVCSERCPTEGAIVLDDRMRPRIVNETCTKCGICVFVCPAPTGGFALEPEEGTIT